MGENILGAEAPDERRSKGDIFYSHFHATNIVNQLIGTKRKN